MFILLFSPVSIPSFLTTWELEAEAAVSEAVAAPEAEEDEAEAEVEAAQADLDLTEGLTRHVSQRMRSEFLSLLILV